MGAAGVRRNNLRRWRRVLAVLSAAVLWAGLSAPGLADLRIVTDEGGMRHELLLKRGQLATSRGGDFRFVVDCDAGVVTVISSPEKKTYWRGSGDELARQVGDIMRGALESAPQTGDAPGFDLSTILGTGPRSVEVRVNRMGTDTVAGYDAVHYQVQYREEGGDWRTHEDVWVSSGLLRDVEAEVGGCLNQLLSLSDVMESLTPAAMGAAGAVMADPAYKALSHEGYRVRSRSQMQVFGVEINVNSEVVEVSRQPVPADAFTVPAGYRQVDNVVDLMGM